MANNNTGVSSRIYGIVRSKIERLAENAETGDGKAKLANLRRGLGKAPGELPELWGVIFHNVSDELIGKSSEPSYAEWAIYISLTLFAMHFQGGRMSDNAVNDKDISLGRAVAKLVHSEDDESRILRRLTQAVSSLTVSDLENHLRSIISLLKSDGIGLDYALLAKDIYTFQFNEYKNSVRLKWGRDFYSEISSKKEKK